MLAMVPFFLIADPVAANIYWDICLGGIMAVALWFAWHLPGAAGVGVDRARPVPLHRRYDVMLSVYEDAESTARAYPNLGDVFYLQRVRAGLGDRPCRCCGGSSARSPTSAPSWTA